MSVALESQPSRWTSLLSRALRPVVRVEPAEAVTAVVMMVTVFVLLTSYYLLKTAREPLILLHGGAEVKSYAAAGQAILLLVAYWYENRESGEQVTSFCTTTSPAAPDTFEKPQPTSRPCFGPPARCWTAANARSLVTSASARTETNSSTSSSIKR